MTQITNDLAHFSVAIVVGFLVAAGVTFDLSLIIAGLLGALGGTIIGVLAEFKEFSPNIQFAALETFSIRDIIGYAIGGGVIAVVLKLIAT